MPSRLRDPRELLREFRRRRTERRMAGNRLLTAFAQAYPRAFFLEVGAHDGVTGDQLHTFVLSSSWSGLLVEPLPEAFRRLRENYAGVDRVALENAAIADHDGTVTLHHFAEPSGAGQGEAEDARGQMGSLSRELVERNAASLNSKAEVVSTEVPCLTLGSLLRKHSVDRLDLVQIDTEGYDHEVIRQIDFSAHRPRVLVYEDIHLSPEQRDECNALLGGLGYETLEEALDTWCFDAVPDDALTGEWRRIRAAGAAIPRHKLGRWLESAGKRR